MASIVRSSKYRHIFGTANKREECFENLRISVSAWDTNFVAANPKYISVNWNAGGGGAFCIVPHSLVGKLRGEFPLFSAHAGAVLDTAFSPFDDDVVASAAEDHQVMIWRVPKDLEEREEDVTEPVVVLGGHGRKVGHVVWNPVAEGVLAVSSSDNTVKIWDVQTGQVRQTLSGFKDAIMSIAWNHTGTLLAATCRDKKLRIFDVRSGEILQEGDSHTGVKGSRVTWLGNQPRLVTTGFSRSSDREVCLWNADSLEKPIVKMLIDKSAGMLMPFYDGYSNVLYVAGKGDGNIRYYEYADDQLYFLSEYTSSDPQRGLGIMPRRGMDVRKCEVMRFYKVSGNTTVEPISFRVPRKAESFQADIFPPAASGRPAMSADEYFGGKTAEPAVVSMEQVYNDGPLVVGSDAPIASSAKVAPSVSSVSSTPVPTPKAPTPTAAAPAAPILKEPTPLAAAAPAEAPTPVSRSSSNSSSSRNVVPDNNAAEIEALRKENARLKQELESAQKQQSEAETKSRASLEQLQLAEQKARESQQAVEKLKQELAAASATDKADELEAKLKAAIGDADALRAELQSAAGQAEEYKSKLSQAESDSQRQRDSVSALQKELGLAIAAANSLTAAAEKAVECIS
ncbi:Coronin-like protein crn1 [Coemansia sp. RSA 2559]|nr:Coronin-like protein crn1 [Coemansia sp. RSA 2559]